MGFREQVVHLDENDTATMTEEGRPRRWLDDPGPSVQYRAGKLLAGRVRGFCGRDLFSVQTAGHSRSVSHARMRRYQTHMLTRRAEDSFAVERITRKLMPDQRADCGVDCFFRLGTVCALLYSIVGLL